MSSPITIPAGAIDGLVAKAVIDSLSEETKTTVIESAVKFLLAKPQTDRYDKNKLGDSPLEVAFHDAIRSLAREVATEVVQEARPKIAEALQKMVAAIGEAESSFDWDLQAKLMEAILNWREDKEIERRGSSYR